ncbi:MAG: hypothetical protein Q4D98_11870 [Planctomycetia bacterium]|nr:hypothetical protein [Planctomycetia bacterium]
MASARFIFNIPDETMEKIRAIAKKQGRTMSDVMNQLAFEFVRNEHERDNFEKRLQALEQEVFKCKN